MWVVENKFSDLTEYHNGDESRFSRMVGSGGSSFPNSHPDAYAESIIRLSGMIDGHDERLSVIMGQLARWGYTERGDEIQTFDTIGDSDV